MSYPHHHLDLQLQRERTEALYREFAAEDDGSFDAALDRLTEEESEDVLL